MTEWNKIIYDDCMNEKNGLPTLEDKSIDLCLTDPEYSIFDIKWLEEILRICNGLIFTPGKTFIYDYTSYKKPNYRTKYWYCPNSSGYQYLIEPFLCYGKIKRINYLREVFEISFSVQDPRIKDHPYPKLTSVYLHILNRLKPKSVIDPFIGSGTTAEVCIKLGIPWIGYEINRNYKQDIERRLKGCKKEPKQQILMVE